MIVSTLKQLFDFFTAYIVNRRKVYLDKSKTKTTDYGNNS